MENIIGLGFFLSLLQLLTTFSAISDLLIGFFVVPIMICTVHLKYFRKEYKSLILFWHKILLIFSKRPRNTHDAGPDGFSMMIDDNSWVKLYLRLFVCKFINDNFFSISSFFTSLSLTSSLYALMFYSVERFIAIKNPLKYHNR